jgi:hypothetical protein
MIAKFLQTYNRRKWVYALCETSTLTIVFMCVVFHVMGHGYPITIGAGVVAFAVLILASVVREQDDHK